jgi:hypothetical protein
MRFSRLLPAAIASLAVLCATVANSAPSNVVYGNLGSSGTGSLSATNTDFGGGTLTDPVASLAQGFTTGTSSQYLTLQGVTLGLFSDDTPATRTVSIYTDNAGVPGTSLYTSSSQAVTSTGKYVFTFPNSALSPSTSYWIVPQGPASWYFNDLEDQPTAQNASGWSYLGTKRALTADPTAWINSSGPYSVSVQAVPEPSTYALAGIGIAAAGLLRWRLRQSRR